MVQIVDTSGKTVNEYSYDEWGNITSQTEGISNPFKYTGEIYDEETGLYYLRARYYDPSIGRFLNEDTYEGQIDNPLSLNLYTYVENNPLTNVDPTGHSSAKTRTYLFGMRHPIIAKKIGEVKAGERNTNISTVAVRFATNDLGFSENTSHEGSQVNAYRHALWQAMITVEFGQSIAIEVGNAHEENPKVDLSNRVFDFLSKADQSIDLLNNLAGRQIGASISENASTKSIALATLDYFHTTGLYVADSWYDGSSIRYSIVLRKLSDKEYEKARERLIQLDDNGFAEDQ